MLTKIQSRLAILSTKWRRQGRESKSLYKTNFGLLLLYKMINSYNISAKSQSHSILCGMVINIIIINYSNIHTALSFRTLLYYLDLLYTNMCPIEIPAKGQLRDVSFVLAKNSLVGNSDYIFSRITGEYIVLFHLIKEDCFVLKIVTLIYLVIFQCAFLYTPFLGCCW